MAATKATDASNFSAVNAAHINQTYVQRLALIQASYDRGEISLNEMESLKANEAINHDPLTEGVLNNVLFSIGANDPHNNDSQSSKFLKDKEDFQPVKKNRRRKAKTSDEVNDKRVRTGMEKPTNELSTNNPFEALSDLEEMDASSDNPRSTNQFDGDQTSGSTVKSSATKSTRPEGKIPPIFFLPEENWKKVLQDLKAGMQVNPSATLIGEHIKLCCANSDEYRKCVAFLTDKSIQFHSFSLKADRPLKVVLRGIPINTTDSDIQASLQEAIGNAAFIKYVRRMKHPRTRQPMPLFLACLSNINQDSKSDIYKVNNLMGLQVKIEAHRGNGFAPMCWRCNGFFHSSEVCRLNPRCMKCAEEHLTNNCPNTDKPLKCCNCGGAHAANYRQCPKNPANKSKGQIKSKINTVQRKPEPKTSNSNQPKGAVSIDSSSAFPPLPSANHSYAKAVSAAGNSKQINTKIVPPNKENSQSSSDFADMFKLTKEIVSYCKNFNFKDIVALVKQTKEALNNCSEPLDKLMIIAEAFFSLFSKINNE